MVTSLIKVLTTTYLLESFMHFNTECNQLQARFSIGRRIVLLVNYSYTTTVIGSASEQRLTSLYTLASMSALYITPWNCFQYQIHYNMYCVLLYYNTLMTCGFNNALHSISYLYKRVKAYFQAHIFQNLNQILQKKYLTFPCGFTKIDSTESIETIVTTSSLKIKKNFI